jgi:flagellar biosynthesis protein FlhG
MAQRASPRMVEPRARDSDQAAGLRRLFGVAPARLAPVLVDTQGAASQVASIVRLAQACARIGERTLVLDCARVQVAASLGLRARFDLLHVLRGDCNLEQVRLDAGLNLGIIPAARALAQARGAEAEFMALLGALANGPLAADLVLLILDAPQAILLRTAIRGEVIVPIARERSTWSDLLRSLARLANRTDIAGFRLLFPAWDADTAARLYAELVQACSTRLQVELRFGGALRVAHDWLRVARTMNEWELLRLPRPQTVRTF